jgi:hypothetical protein
MAKAKVKNLDEAINSIFKRYNSNLRKAVEDAAKKAEFDINFKAESCLERYYENYFPKKGEPNWYERTHSLKQAFVSVNEVTTNKDYIVARVGVVYDPSRLDGVYNSNASERYTPVDSEWVLRNYLRGRHPRTNGWPIYNEDDGRAIYDPWDDKVSPDDTMQAYIENYKDTFDQNVLRWLAGRVIKR